jgi:hypothetical protein
VIFMPICFICMARQIRSYAGRIVTCKTIRTVVAVLFQFHQEGGGFVDMTSYQSHYLDSWICVTWRSSTSPYILWGAPFRSVFFLIEYVLDDEECGVPYQVNLTF